MGCEVFLKCPQPQLVRRGSDLRATRSPTIGYYESVRLQDPHLHAVGHARRLAHHQRLPA
jgi:hypothetical protein